MVTRRKRNLERSQLDALPFIQLMNDVESEIVDQISDTGRNDNRLIGRDTPEGPPVEMIEVRVRNEDGIDRREIIDMQTGALKPLDHAQPHRPIGINEDVHPTELNEKRRMPNPSDANSAGLYLWKKRIGARTTSFGKK